MSKKPVRKTSVTTAATERKAKAEIRSLASSPLELRRWLDRNIPFIVGPRITSFEPAFGAPGTLVTITGSGFSTVREENTAVVGGQPAFVASATATELRVLTADGISTGPVKVTVGARTAVGPHDFAVRGYPAAGGDDDGPPIAFAGSGSGQQGDANPIGTIKVLVALVTPADLAPTAAARAAVIDAWNKVITYYNQASYGKTIVQVDITTAWKPIDANRAAMIEDSNVAQSQIGRMMAFAAQGAVDEGFSLNNYTMMAAVMFLDGEFIRAWGGWSQQNFSYSNGLPPGHPDRIAINLVADHQINLIAIQETADWGRCAHEFGHNVVSAPSFMGDGSATLGEDVYGSDLVDGSAATAQDFELMGNHDAHPLFSGFHLDKLGYYSASKIKELRWDRNPFTQEFDVVAHGLAEDGVADRFHLVKITVADGLHYYVQARQQPGPTSQVFDEQIPIGAAPNVGGICVTSAVADVLHNNQQTRFLTLLHDNRVLKTGDTAEDPARALKITVVNDNVQSRPLVCRVRVEWAQTVADDPDGAFDLKIEPWDSGWQTPDIWVDRAPFGVFDNPTDSEGRPTNNGDRPRPMETNILNTRVHVSGAMGATDVRVTFYAVTPPGVGDNGNWTPLSMNTIPDIPANGFRDTGCNWTPVVGQHTCLKAYASQQFGEISGGNNFAQENVFNFEAPASSPPAPVFVRTAIRNPLDERRLIRIGISGVPQGFRVHFPHAWVWLDPKAERHFDLLVVPTNDYAAYVDRKLPRVAPVRATGWLARQYREALAFHKPAGSRYFTIGGTTNNVRVVKRVTIGLKENREGSKPATVAVAGSITPAMSKQRVRVDLRDPAGALRVVEVMTNANGKFTASFDLRYKPSLAADRKRWLPASSILTGTYRAQAIIHAADGAAAADSNIVFITR